MDGAATPEPPEPPAKVSWATRVCWSVLLTAGHFDWFLLFWIRELYFCLFIISAYTLIVIVIFGVRVFTAVFGFSFYIMVMQFILILSAYLFMFIYLFVFKYVLVKEILI